MNINYVYKSIPALRDHFFLRIITNNEQAGSCSGFLYDTSLEIKASHRLYKLSLPPSCSELILSIFISIHRQSSHYTANVPENYDIKSSGTNSQGNHYRSRDYGSSVSNSNSYHYSNTDGSYYYSNPNGSTYHNNGQGGSTYTAPSGNSYSSGSGKK
ncbi:hypothetical protein EDB82DRAFT_552200 [Fusarium venenatum]|uniref:uncharacterized protein n=1 Tax=Fusarium venenatum TaxID=56646 RepID=UPI001D4D74CF|nr:hypothetical protein EDB82DRAFT_552200 [Fusarium venenatum]